MSANQSISYAQTAWAAANSQENVDPSGSKAIDPADDYSLGEIVSEAIVRNRKDVVANLTKNELREAFIPAPHSGWTLLHAACVSPNMDLLADLWAIAPELCEPLKDSEARRAGTTNWTPLHLAIRHRNFNALSFLLLRGVDPNKCYSEHESYRADGATTQVNISPLSYCCMHGTMDMLLRLAEECSPSWIDTIDELNRPLLYWAVKQFEDPVTQREIVEYILEERPEQIFLTQTTGRNILLNLLSYPRMDNDVKELIVRAAALVDHDSVGALLMAPDARGISAMQFALQGNWKFLNFLVGQIKRPCPDIPEIDISLALRHAKNGQLDKAMFVIEALMYPLDGEEKSAANHIGKTLGDPLNAWRCARIYGAELSLKFLQNALNKFGTSNLRKTIGAFLNEARGWSRAQGQEAKYKSMKEITTVMAKYRKLSFKTD